MTPQPLTRRGAARRAAIAVASASAVAASFSAWAVVSPDVAGAAPVDSGIAQIVTPAGGANAGQPMTTGGSATAFTIKLPTGAACASDGENGGRAHTYMIPAAESPATNLAFNGNGSVVGQATGSGGTGTFKQNLFTTNNLPGRTIPLNVGDAKVINIPNFDLDVFTTGQIPAGVYNVGIACLDLDEEAAINNFWNTQISIAADNADPKGIAFTVTPPAPSSTTSTTASGATSTTAAGGGTTSTTASGGSTTSTSSGSSTSLPGVSTTLGSRGGGSGLPSTGADVLRMTVWALLFAVFGRIAIILGRSAPTGRGPEQ